MRASSIGSHGFRVSSVALSVALLLGATELSAQQGREQVLQLRSGRAAGDLAAMFEGKVERQSRLEWGAWSSPSFLSFSDVDNDKSSANTLHSLAILDQRLWGRWDGAGGQTAYLRARYLDLRYDLSEGGSRPTIFEEGLTLDLGYYDFRWGNWQIRTGRQYHSIGRGLVFDGNLDGMKATFRQGQWEMHAVGGKTPRYATDLDPNVGRSRRNLMGLSMSHATPNDHRIFAYWFAQDQRGHVEVDFQGLDYDSEYFAVGAEGPVRNDVVYYLEAIQENGLSAELGRPIGGEPVDANALLAELEFRPDRRHHPTMQVRLAHGSGDPDRQSVVTNFQGNVRLTDDTAFVGLGQFDGGLALSPRLANLNVLSVGTTYNLLEPPKDDDILTLALTGHVYRKDDAEGVISNPAGNLNSPDVGKGLDLRAAYRPGHDLTVTLHASRFMPGAAFEPLTRVDSTLVYASFTYSY
ncbi:MAG: alginate export family protein [Candidatus Wallbacteria bacterium]|nr:alginate export family protein [Candidatus Wallbacteria bacterium]